MNGPHDIPPEGMEFVADDGNPLGQHLLATISMDEIRTKMRSLVAMNARGAPFEEITAALRGLLHGYSSITHSITTEKAWRARRHESPSFFEHVRELWYPPGDRVTTFGRLRQPGQSLLYISASHQSATLEMHPKVGDRLTILEVGLRDASIRPHVMEVGLAEVASMTSEASNFRILENTREGLAFLQGHETKDLSLRSFLAHELMRIVPTDREDLYRLSAAIGEILMDSPKVDGVVYPSIAGDDHGMNGAGNMALKPASADRLFEPRACWVIDIEGRAEAGHVAHCVRRARAIQADGTITW